MKITRTLVIAAGMLASCGTETKKGASSPAGPDATWQTSITSLTNTDASVKAVKQAYADATELADLTEIMTTGLDDGSGTFPTPRSFSPQFTYAVDGAVDLNNVTQPFVAAATFHAKPSPNGSVEGNATFRVAPTVAVLASQGTLQVLNLAPAFSLERTTNANEIFSVSAGGTLTVTKSGRRQDGKVERVLIGDVHRVLTSAADANANFDYHFTYKGLKVVDVYTAGKLASRSLAGEVAMDGGYSVQFSEAARSNVALCLCPTSGAAIGSYPQGDEGDGAVTFTFGAACGAVSAKRLETDVFTGASIDASLVLQGCAPTAVEQ